MKDKLPEGVIQIKAPSDFVCVAGRTAVNDEDEADKKEALAFQSQYEIGTMSKFFPDFKANPVEALTFPVYNEATVTTPAFFSILNFLLPHMKLSDEEAVIIKNFESIGVHANGEFTFLK